MRALALALLLSVDGGHEHCWHFSTMQHAVTCHYDEVCCHCGEARCRHPCWSDPQPQPGHGPYAPGALPLLVAPDGGYIINLTGGYVLTLTGARDGG